MTSPAVEQKRYLAVIVEEGLVILGIRQNKHIVARCRTPDGREVSISIPHSGGSSRTFPNFCSFVRSKKSGARL